MEPKCEYAVSPGSVDTVPSPQQYHPCRCRGVSAGRRGFPSDQCEPKCLSLNAECKTEQLMCEVKLKNIPITTDKDFILTLLKTYQVRFCQNNLHSISIPHREKWYNSASCLEYFTGDSFPHFSVRFDKRLLRVHTAVAPPLHQLTGS